MDSDNVARHYVFCGQHRASSASETICHAHEVEYGKQEIVGSDSAESSSGARALAEALDFVDEHPLAVNDNRHRIGAVLERVEEARSAGEIETKEQALEMAANTLRYPGGRNPAGQPAPEIHGEGLE